MPKNKDLNKAAKNKKDEFYTQLSDIEKELKNYKQYFKDKTIFLNCDDPEYSNFWKYFHLNFYEFGIKKLISTHYETEKPSYKMEIVRNGNGEGQLSLPDYIKTPLKQNGDFRSPECIEILKEADIIITNPPFSLFREYITQLLEYDKKFIIIGNIHAAKYKEVFPYIKENKVWLGKSIHSGDREFAVPDSYPLEAAGYRIDDTGRKYIRVKGIRWFTNLEYDERKEDLILYKRYTPEEYPKYINFDAIDISKTSEIPCDYYGFMGVPITFIDSYNPEQFEIIGLGSGYLGQSIGITGILPEHKKQMRGHSAAGDLYYLLPNGKPKVPFARVIIRRRQNEN